MGNTKKFRNFIWLLFTVLLFVATDSLIRYENSYSVAEKKVIKSLAEVQRIQSQTIIKWQNDTSGMNLRLRFPFDEKKLNLPAVYIFENDTLAFWNSNILDPKFVENLPFEEHSLIQNNNYLFYVSQTENDSSRFVAATLLYRNNFLHNSKNCFVPTNINGDYSIDFEYNDGVIIPTMKLDPIVDLFSSLVLFVLMLVVQFFLYRHCYFLLRNCRWFSGKYLVFLFLSVLAYLLFGFLRSFLFISTSPLYSDICIKSEFFDNISLGKLSELVFLIIANIWVFVKIVVKRKITVSPRSMILGTISFALVYYLFMYVLFVIIQNSVIPLSFLRIYNINIYSYIFLILITVLTSSVVVLLEAIIGSCCNRSSSIWLMVLCYILFAVIIHIVYYYLLDFPFCYLTFSIGLLLFVVLSYKNIKQNKKTFVNTLIIITFVSILLTHFLYNSNEEKEIREMNRFAFIVGDESDAEFEKKINEICDAINADDTIAQWNRNNNFPTEDSISHYLAEYYFNDDITDDYYKLLTVCRPNTYLLTDAEDTIGIKCFEYFDNIIDNNYTRYVNDNTVIIDDHSTDTYYLTTFEYFVGDTVNMVMFIEFYKEYIMNSIKIAEFLTSYKNIVVPDLSNYSFCTYTDGILNYKYGHYNYPSNFSEFRYKEHEYVKTNHYKHLLTDIDNKTVIVTVETARWIEIIAPFSYIFIALLLAYYLMKRLEYGKKYVRYRKSFHSKMQLMMLMTLTISFLVVGFTSFIFIKDGLARKTSRNRYERTKSILKTLQKDVDEGIDLSDPDVVRRFKEVYFIDINLYNTDGYLINTTQPELFNTVSTRKINKNAYHRIINKKFFFYSHNEYIGNVEYQSDYNPIFDSNGNLVAVLNIPYYDYNDESHASMANFIVTYINIIFVLLGVSVIVVIVITRNTFKPLVTIQENMKRLHLRGENEPIEWHSNDEIGDLINQYNNLLKELEESAGQLMRVERESAWRDMARQVAHEIKNPLTPMKLSVQYLQMAWKRNDKDIERKFNDTMSSILEQIDTLTSIATAFSNYAKLPQNTPEEFDLREMLDNLIYLYDNQLAKNIVLQFDHEGKYMIYADRNNLGRVFGNIIKNAIQAIDNMENGSIVVKIEDVGNKYRIWIIDNGCGIKPEEQKKIFLPNFTTKSSGMGLGLSIAFDIIESMGGKIGFKSEVGIGTTFKVEIPKGKDF